MTKSPPAWLKVLTPEVIRKLTPQALDALMAQVVPSAAASAEHQKKSKAPYPQYQNDPYGFCTKVLGESFAPDVIPVMESVRDNPVTIARSANATGKCVAFGETILLADGTRRLAETLIGQSFAVWSVDPHLRKRVSDAFATDNGIQPVARITTHTGRSIVRTVNHPLLSANSVFASNKPPLNPHWVQVGQLKPGDVVLTVEAKGFAYKLERPIDWMRKGLPDGFTWESVRAIEYLASMPTVAITVPGDQTFLTEFVEHNTHVAARIAVWWHKCFNASQVYTAAAPPERNLQTLLWGEIGSVLTIHESLFTHDTASTVSMMISRAKNQFVMGVTIPASGKGPEREARFSGKHAPHLLFIIDEGDAVPMEVYKGIESCMSGGHARLLIMFNPRAKSGPVYRMENNREGHVVKLTAFNHPNVVTGENLIPGAVDRETTVRRINEWTRPLLPGEEIDDLCFDIPDFLVSATCKSKAGIPYPPLPATQRKVTAPEFCYMVMGEYPPQGSDQLISEEWLNNARARWDAYVAMNGERPPQGTRPVMGVDVAEWGVDANVAILRYGGWVPHMQSWSGVDTLVTGDRVADLFRKYDPAFVYVDANGVGTGVGPQAERNLRATPMVGKKSVRPGVIVSVKTANSPTEKVEFGEFNLLRDQLWWKVREWLRTDPGAMLPPDEELLEELLVPKYAILGGKIRVMAKDEMKKLLGRSPDRADALCLTFAPDQRTFKIGFV